MTPGACRGAGSSHVGVMPFSLMDKAAGKAP